MNTGAFLQAIRADGRAALDAARRGLDAPVPTTPGWTVGDVMAHLGQVHRQKTHIVRESLVDEVPDGPRPPAGVDLLEWFEEGLHELTSVLAATDPATRVHTWHEPDQSVGFWIRRMAHETLIHRVDAELGHAIHTPVDPVLGADGIDEILTVMMAGWPDWAAVARSEVTVGLESEGRSWQVRFGSWSGTSPKNGRRFQDVPGIELVTDAGRPTAVVRGPGDALDLFLWGRGSADGLVVEGHPSVLLYLRDVAADATD
ncbi:MAG: maleylpyruvate isomerase family mycothiol-dependent enzyme [Acidimicrobiia bacterium]|nr:maleylpyruvate isomerase family mycothiol-dependent enzyme [Acidimicrobiia bacterium]